MLKWTYKLWIIGGFIGILFLSFRNLYVDENDMKTNRTQKEELTIFLCGDVMTGRGIDQVMPQSVEPILYESYVKNARTYVELAERANGKIPKPVSYRYIWGDALQVWQELNPAFKLINLETSITTSDQQWPDKGIHYRMHPDNTQLFKAAGIDYCALSNNHVLDWGHQGLTETMQSLKHADIVFSGAGNNMTEASKPAILSDNSNQVLVFSYGSETSGIPKSWAAKKDKAGVNFIQSYGSQFIRDFGKKVPQIKEKGDIILFSIHWGSNWGHDIPDWQQNFAKALIDEANVDIICGHSSHHPKGIDVYKNKLIIYGAGDFINDYEGITGHEQFRGDLILMYFPGIDPETGNLKTLKLVPMQIKNFRLNYASQADARWLNNKLNQEGEIFDTDFHLNEDLSIDMKWN